jgi:hypothetical protein
MAKFGIKKIVIALAGLGLTGAAFASITPNSAFSNPTPTGYGWHATAMGDWLRPNTNNLEFASVNSASASTSGNNSNFVGTAYGASVDPNYDFGYGFEVGMQIPGSTDDVTVNWQQLDKDSSDTANIPGPNSVLVLPDFNNVSDAKSTADFDFDAVNVEFGHTIYNGPWAVRPFAGLQYARIKLDQDTTGLATSSGTFSTTNVVDSIDEDSDFHGIGGRVGVDGKYNLGYGFGLVGEAAADLLVGSSDSTFSSTNVATTSLNSGSGSSSADTTAITVSPEEQHTVVPGLEAKAGLSYDQVINPALCLGIEAGYYVADYVHALPKTNAPVDAVSQASQGSSTFFARNSNTDFNMEGPYVAVSLNF